MFSLDFDSLSSTADLESFSHFVIDTISNGKAWFSDVGKIPDGLGFHCFPTVPDFADISDIRRRSVPDFPDYEFGGTWKARQTRNLNTNVTAFQ